MIEQINLKGTVDHIVYRNDDNGYTVFSVAIINEDGEDDITCVGFAAELCEGEEVEILGSYVTHPVYGEQLNAKSIEKRIPTEESDICKYLGSGVIKGIRQKTAEKITAMFGKGSFDVIENDPEKLTAIKGITLKRALDISATFKEQSEMRRIMIFLQKLDISPAYSIKIYKQYKERTFDVVKNNPYALVDDVHGIGFKTADAIASRLGTASNSPYRIEASIKYALTEAAFSGHTYLPRSALIEKIKELISVPTELVEQSIMELQFSRRINQEPPEDENDDASVYLNYYHYAENYIAKKLLQLARNVKKPDNSIENDIDDIEKKSGIKLAKEQREALRQVKTNGVLVITGGPGTGKTTTIKAIISLLEKYGDTIELAAPTGRAAKRITESSDREARTIHRLLKNKHLGENGELPEFMKNEDDPLESDVIIVDESSMIDTLLMSSLLKAVPIGAKLILVGDVNQLPSIGAGNVLKDIIKSGCVKVVELNEIFRQAQESAIIMNAHRINDGEYPKLNEKNSDFFFVRTQNAEEVAATVANLVKTRLPAFLSLDPSLDIQVITPMRKSAVGTYTLNNALQQVLNPKSPDKNERAYGSFCYREGDKVMQIKNNYSMPWRVVNNLGLQIDEGEGVFNGDIGVLREIDEDSESFTVVFDGNKIVRYDFNQLEELEPAYAITIHKSQGSEYKAVVIPIFGGSPMLLTRHLLYTAVTRAKSLAVIVGSGNTLYRMIDNDQEVYRYTALERRMRKMQEFV
ncbi:MAG: ATP-dependent RecD-like DNA helicase [Defluviitaleaceae bacterium]|nr:ATP-dependent RecD-like DNA helicase [Defluviitaleaceae bacterium]